MEVDGLTQNKVTCLRSFRLLGPILMWFSAGLFPSQWTATVTSSGCLARGLARRRAPGAEERESNCLITRRRMCCREEAWSLQWIYPDVCRGGDSRGHLSGLLSPPPRPRPACVKTRLPFPELRSSSAVAACYCGSWRSAQAAATPERLKTLKERPWSVQ